MHCREMVYMPTQELNLDNCIIFDFKDLQIFYINVFNGLQAHHRTIRVHALMAKGDWKIC